MVEVVLVGATAALGFIALGRGVFVTGSRLDNVENNKQGGKS